MRSRATLAPKAHAVLVLDQAGWHTTDKLRLPENLSLLPLPPKSPELNPVENVWQFLRQNKLSNRIFGDYEAIVAAACEAWNTLLADPARITSIGTRQWATIAHDLRAVGITPLTVFPAKARIHRTAPGMPMNGFRLSPGLRSENR